MPRQPPHASSLRKGRVSEPGRVYLVTTVTHQRTPFFAEFHHARTLVTALRGEALHQRAETLAWVIMPDHLHWLLTLHPGARLSQVVGSVKSVTAHAIGQRLWQAGFHDHALRNEEDLPAIARYMVANPVRKGLVCRVGDWPHWDAIWL